MRGSFQELTLLFALPAALLAQPAPAGAVPAAPPALYAIRLTKGPAWDEAKGPNEQAGMREHSANVARMRREGVLVHGARFGELGLLVLRVPDEAAARQQFEPDPTIASGVFHFQVDRYAPFAHGTTAWPMTPEAVLLRAYLDAVNRMDAPAVAAMCAEDFVWHAVEGDALKPEVRGRAALLEWLNGYFRDIPSVRTEFLSLEQTGPFLTVRERATWRNQAGATVAQQAIGVYEIRDGLIRRAWYFPSAKEPAPPAPR
jgi:ketosteroid isomerase-like protein